MFLTQKSTLLNVVVCGSLVAITLGVTLIFTDDKTEYYEHAMLFGIGTFFGYCQARWIHKIELKEQIEKYECVLDTDALMSPPTAATDVSHNMEGFPQ